MKLINIKLKMFILFIIAALLLIPTSTVIANNIEKPIDSKKTITIWMPGSHGEEYFIKEKITEENFIKINQSLSESLDQIHTTLDENSEDGTNISYSEWDTIKTSIYGVIYAINDIVGENFPLGIILVFINSLIDALRGPFYLVRQPLISLGIGYTLIPFYEYETFIGKLLKPVFMRHLIGFSFTARLNPFVLGFPYWYFGFQKVRTFFFDGLLINFADLGRDRIIGPQLLLGYGVFTGLIQ